MTTNGDQPNLTANVHPTRTRAGSASFVGMAISLSVGCLTYLLHPLSLLTEPRLLVAWCATLLCALILAWSGILRTTVERTKNRATLTDPGTAGTLIISIVTCIASLAGAIYVQTSPHAPAVENHRSFIEAMIICTLFGGWALLNTTFALHYARMYYGNGEHPGGFAFPEGAPDELDFAYVAFGIGVGFQMSDITVTNKSIRRTVLVHSILSFVYNVAVTAIAVNVIFELL